MVGVAFSSLLLRPNRTPTPAHTEPATEPPPTEEPPYPIFTAAEAISIAEANVHPIPVTSPVVKLISHQTLGIAWLEYSQESVDTSDWPAHSPVWLVGFRSPDLTAGQVASSLVVPSDDSSPVEGVYTAFDANSGRVVLEGALGEQFAPRTYLNLTILPNEQLAVVRATQLP